MKPDRLIAHQTLLTAKDVARGAKVQGAGEPRTVEGRRMLAVQTPAVVELMPPRPDLSPFNVLALNLRLAEPFDGSLVSRLVCSTRRPGMAENDSYFSVVHFNQPRTWRGWQRVLIPAVNLVPTGFPNGWKDIASIRLDVHSRGEPGTVIVGDLELMQVQSPRGPRMSDAELLEALDLDRPELSGVRRRAARGDTDGAVAAFAAHLRKAKLPPAEVFRESSHYPPSSAEEMCRHVILGQQLPPRIDWHANPIGYLEWNHAFNRHYWMPALAEAHRATGRQRYAGTLNELIRTWIEQNPEPVGHNGGLDPAWETLSTSCRVNWAWVHLLHLAQRTKALTDRVLVDMAKMLHAHAEHLLRYWGHNNWYISESTAILTVAAFLPCFRRAEEWRRAAVRRLEREMRRQVFPDGAQFELSPGYHTMCAELLHSAWRRAAFRGWEFSGGYRRRLWAMFDFLAGLSRPDGTYPVPNDAGCAMPDRNERLAQAGRQAGRQDWLWAGSGGSQGSPPAVGSVHYPDAGYAVMRSGWQRHDRWAFFDMGAFGASHQHEDKLQVELYAYGACFLVDPGISSYQADPVVRFFRTSQAHNTIIVDGLGQARRASGDLRAYESSSRGQGSPTAMNRGGVPQNLWAAGRGMDFARGSYGEPYGQAGGTGAAPNEAAPLLRGIRHTRAVVFVRPDYWLILDTVAGHGTHRVQALWHFAPMHVRAEARSATVRTDRLALGNLELICRGDWQGGRIELITAREQPVQGFIALDKEIKPTTCAVVSRRKALPLHGVTAAVPYGTGSESHFRVHTRPARSRGARGDGITVRRPDGAVDRFLWRHTGRGEIEADGMRSDGLLSLVRTDPRGQVAYAAIMDGRRLGFGKLRLRGKPGAMVER